MISIELPCPMNLTSAQTSSLAKLPTLVMFGDHRSDVQAGPANWANSFDTCQKFVQQMKDAGGDAEMMYLLTLGIRGHIHMLVQDRNNLQLADLILTCIVNNDETQNTLRR